MDRHFICKRPYILALLPVILAGLLPAQDEIKWSNVLVAKIAESPQLIEKGEELYRHACFYCHGEKGDGKGRGSDYLYTKPRDFTLGEFKIRTTLTGSLPTDEDIFRSITTGFPEFSMPRFAYLSPEERWGLVYYIKKFHPDFVNSKLVYPKPIGSSPDIEKSRLLARGEILYQEYQCGSCHGLSGKGDGPSAPELLNSDGTPSRVAAFALGSSAYKRGSAPEDIVQTFNTGLSGTPMPSYDGILSSEDAWAIAYYVQSLAENK